MQGRDATFSKALRLFMFEKPLPDVKKFVALLWTESIFIYLSRITVPLTLSSLCWSQEITRVSSVRLRPFQGFFADFYKSFRTFASVARLTLGNMYPLTMNPCTFILSNKSSEEQHKCLLKIPPKKCPLLTLCRRLQRRGERVLWVGCCRPTWWAPCCSRGWAPRRSQGSPPLTGSQPRWTCPCQAIPLLGN